MSAIAVVRVRGSVGVRREIEETLRRLRLTRVNHCVVVRDDPATLGMIKKAKDYITWGEVDHEILREMILTRGEFVGGGEVTEEELKKRTGMDIDTFVEKVLSGEIKLSDYLKPFRLHPPRKGYRSTKLPYPEGALGYRGSEINSLLRRMI